MHLKSASVPILLSLALVIGAANGELRLKRQAQRGRQVSISGSLSPATNSMATASLGTTGIASSMVGATGIAGGSAVDMKIQSTASGPARPVTGGVGAVSEEDEDSIAEDRPPIRRPPVRPATRPQKSHGHRNEYEEEEDCYDDDYGDYHNMFSMAAHPMRHFSRMMGKIMDQMPFDGGASGDGFEYGNGVSASAVGSSDGYSRVSSSVSNNGRTRGIISETRNGRTQTRRFGDNGDSNEEDQ